MKCWYNCLVIIFNQIPSEQIDFIGITKFYVNIHSPHLKFKRNTCQSVQLSHFQWYNHNGNELPLGVKCNTFALPSQRVVNNSLWAQSFPSVSHCAVGSSTLRIVRRRRWFSLSTECTLNTMNESTKQKKASNILSPS